MENYIFVFKSDIFKYFEQKHSESPADFNKNLDRLSNEWHLLRPLGERFVAYFRKY